MHGFLLHAEWKPLDERFPDVADVVPKAKGRHAGLVMTISGA
jgi:hypothetical protein